MIKQTWNINEEERNRILNLHENATKNQYLMSEQNKMRGPGMKTTTDTTNMSYSQDIGDFFSSGEYESNKVKNLIASEKPKIEEFIKKNGGKKFVVKIDSGESQVTNPKGFEKKGSLALARANSVKKYFSEIFSDLIKNGSLVIKAPSDVNQVKIGKTPYKIGDDVNDKKYKSEQFVKFVIKSVSNLTETKDICEWDYTKVETQGDPSLDYITTNELVSGKGDLIIGAGNIPDRMIVIDDKGVITQDTGYVATGVKTTPYSEFKLVPLFVASLTKLNNTKSVSGNKLVKIFAENYNDLLQQILVNPNSTNYKSQATLNPTEVGNGLKELKRLSESGVKEFIGYNIISQNEIVIPFDTSKGDYKVQVFSPIGETGYYIKGSC
jgi:hypothetical protein